MNFRNLAAAAAALALAAAAHADDLVYAGTYTGSDSRGIYGYRFDPRNGRLKSLGLMAAISNPTVLLAHPDHRYLYAVSDSPAGVSAFLLYPKTGKLALVSTVVSSSGAPCNLAIDRSGRYLAVAYCGSGAIAVLPLRKDGGLVDAPALELPGGKQARPASLIFSPDNRFLLVADEAQDRIALFQFDAETGKATPAATPFVAAPSGAGVQCLAFHPNGHVIYGVNAKRPGVTAFRYDPEKGSLYDFQTLGTSETVPTGVDLHAEIAVNAAGTVVYAASEASNSMALLLPDPDKFTLSVLEFTPLVGSRPRDFTLDPSGAYLLVANEDSNNLTVYSVHPRTGQLRPTGRGTPPIFKPASIVVVTVTAQ